MSRLLVAVIVAALFGAFAQVAGADSTCQAYNPQLPCNLKLHHHRPPTQPSQPSQPSDGGTGHFAQSVHKPPPTSNRGQLPFTGLDLVLLVVLGGGMLVGGNAVRRLSA